MPRKALPRIAESAGELLSRRRLEHDERRRERLHGPWLLASGAAASRLVLAQRLGRNRATIGRWLDDYTIGGLAALLAPDTPPGPAHQGGIVLAATVLFTVAGAVAATRARMSRVAPAEPARSA